MKAKGNGNPAQCVNNLCRMARGECAMERIKGLNPRHIGTNSADTTDIQSDVDWAVGVFEPRVNIKNINIKIDDEQGNFSINVESEV